MNLKAWIVTGRIPAVHPAAAVLLAAFLLISLLFRKSFCSWLCPIGTLSEYLWRAGRKIFGRNFVLPRAVDLPLRGLKYLLLGFFLWAIGGMSAAAIEAFMESPYGLIADVKMLNFFRYLSATAAIVLGVVSHPESVGAKLLVPLPVPVRGAGRTGFPSQSFAHSP
jgi:polyferredoxin